MYSLLQGSLIDVTHDGYGSAEIFLRDLVRWYEWQ